MAITRNIATEKKHEGNLTAFAVASGETIYQGSLVGINASGYLVNITAANANTIKLVGVVADASANSTPVATTANGSISGGLHVSSAIAGDKTVRNVWLSGQFLLTFTSITQAMVGVTVFASDNYTVDETLTGARVGTLVTYISATSGWVDLNKFARDGGFVIAGALTAVTGTSAGGILAVANPYGSALLVEEFLLNVTTKSTGAGTGDYGVAANGTTSSDTLLDGTNMETTGYHSIGVNGGTNGKYGRVWGSTQFITGTASATLAGLVGTYIAVVRPLA
jgi:hypothetical protein